MLDKFVIFLTEYEDIGEEEEEEDTLEETTSGEVTTTSDDSNTSVSTAGKHRHPSISESFSNASCNSDAAEVVKERITRK